MNAISYRSIKLQKKGSVLYACTHIVLQVAYAVTYGYVKPDEDWLYQESLFDETPETDLEGEKTFERIRPMLEASGCQLENE